MLALVTIVGQNVLAIITGSGPGGERSGVVGVPAGVKTVFGRRSGHRGRVRGLGCSTESCQQSRSSRAGSCDRLVVDRCRQVILRNGDRNIAKVGTFAPRTKRWRVALVEVVESHLSETACVHAHDSIVKNGR